MDFASGSSCSNVLPNVACDIGFRAARKLRQPVPKLAQLIAKLDAKHQARSRQNEHKQNHHHTDRRAHSERRPARERDGEAAKGDGYKDGCEDQKQHGPKKPQQQAEPHKSGNEQTALCELGEIGRRGSARAHGEVNP
jgi:hypothetical protein